MRINDIGKHFMSAEFSKLAKTTKRIRESKLLEGTPGAEMNEAPTDQYTKPISRHLVKMDNLQDQLRRSALSIHKMDDGDLTDQVTTMLKLLDKFDEVMQRSFAIIPESTVNDQPIVEDNSARAGKIAKLLGLRGNDTPTEYNRPADAISDLMHFCDANSIGFDQEMQMAEKYYSSEMDEGTVNEKSKGLWHNIHQKRKRGEKPAKPGEKGYPKTLDIESVQEATPTSEFDYDIKKFFAKVQELEDENQHGEVAQMLTQLYGTSSELMIIRGINGIHANQGSIDPEEQKLRDKISTKYYYQAQKEAGGSDDYHFATGERFPKNTSATQGKRMGAESIGEARTNMFGVQVRDIDDKIKDTETQIMLAKKNQGGWREKDIPKLESKLAHLKMKKEKGIKEEAEKKPYICVHAKKGKHECHATSSYGAAKKAAEHWGLKNTSGIDAHLAVEEGVPGMGMPEEPNQKICCKHCGDELYGEPKTDCAYDINNPNQDNWILVDVDGDGDPDMKISYEPMPEGWMDDAKDAVGSTLGKVVKKVKNDYKERKRLFGPAK